MPRGGAVPGGVASICSITLISVTSRRFCFGRRCVNSRTIIHTDCTERKQVKKGLRRPGGLLLNRLPRGGSVPGGVASAWGISPKSVTSRALCSGRRCVYTRTIIHTGCTERKQVGTGLRRLEGLFLNRLPRGRFIQWSVTPIRELLFIPVALRRSLLKGCYVDLGDYP